MYQTSMMRHIVGYEEQKSEEQINSSNPMSLYNLVLKMFEKKNGLIQKALSYQ